MAVAVTVIVQFSVLLTVSVREGTLTAGTTTDTGPSVWPPTFTAKDTGGGVMLDAGMVTVPVTARVKV